MYEKWISGASSGQSDSAQPSLEGTCCALDSCGAFWRAILSPIRMLEKLQIQYPARCDLPAEHFIGSFIKTILRRSRSRVQGENREVEAIRRWGRKATDIRYSDILAEFVHGDIKFMPRLGMTALSQALNQQSEKLPPDFPLDLAIKTAVSKLR